VALGHASGVVIDVGTAITIDILDGGRFRGGLIVPGFELSARALHEHTALLPRVRVSGPVPLVGTETRSALRAGIFHVTTRGVLGVARSLAAGLGRAAPVVVTGGGGGLLAALAPRRLRHEPDLLVWGMRLLAARQGVR
jgi:type III pantothenate kinase